MSDREQVDVPAEYNFKVDVSGRRLRVTAYIDKLKLTGIAYVGVPSRTTSRRPSDILFYYPERHLKLAEVRIFDRDSGKIIDEPPFIIINVERVDAVYAEELDET